MLAFLPTQRSRSSAIRELFTAPNPFKRFKWRVTEWSGTTNKDITPHRFKMFSYSQLWHKTDRPQGFKWFLCLRCELKWSIHWCAKPHVFCFVFCFLVVFFFFCLPAGADPDQQRSPQQDQPRSPRTSLPPAGWPAPQSYRSRRTCPASEMRSCLTCCSPTAWASWRSSDGTSGSAKRTAATAGPASSVTCGFALGTGEHVLWYHLVLNFVPAFAAR